MLLLLVLPILLCCAQFPLGSDRPSDGGNQDHLGLTCYMGAFYGHSGNPRNFETRTCNPAIKYCGIILHQKAENDLPGVAIRLTCEQAAMHCTRTGIIDAALFVIRCCAESFCNFNNWEKIRFFNARV